MDENQQVIVVKVQDDSVLFAVITLICYFLLFPVGLILNIVGLFTGPKRGCFIAMLIVVFLPALLLFLFLLSMVGISFIQVGF